MTVRDVHEIDTFRVAVTPFFDRDRSQRCPKEDQVLRIANLDRAEIAAISILLVFHCFEDLVAQLEAFIVHSVEPTLFTDYLLKLVQVSVRDHLSSPSAVDNQITRQKKSELGGDSVARLPKAPHH